MRGREGRSGGVLVGGVSRLVSQGMGWLVGLSIGGSSERAGWSVAEGTSQR